MKAGYVHIANDWEIPEVLYVNDNGDREWYGVDDNDGLIASSHQFDILDLKYCFCYLSTNWKDPNLSVELVWSMLNTPLPDQCTLMGLSVTPKTYKDVFNAIGSFEDADVIKVIKNNATVHVGGHPDSVFIELQFIDNCISYRYFR